MNLKPRPMSEAPSPKWLIVLMADGSHKHIFSHNETFKTRPDIVGFYDVDDLLRAAEILAAITPEGYEYEAAGDVEPDTEAKHIWRRVTFRRIAPPVEYEYVTDGKERKPRPGDWIPMHGGFSEVRAGDINFEPQLCYRRVEVKR